MAIPEVPRISLKKAAFGAAALLVVLFVLSMWAGNDRRSLSLSGSVATAPAYDMMGEVGYGAPVARVAGMNKMMAPVESAAYVGYDAGYPTPAPNPTAPAGVSKIVKNGDLSLLVRSVDDAAAAINKLRADLAGQPGNASMSEYGNGGKQGDITIWVPAERFDEAMSAVKALALRVNNERVSVQDVSAQFVDLESRLRNLKSAEIQYQEIMKRSGKISEVLEVTRALNDTRAQIEQAQGQMDYLSRQVALSSIHVSLVQEAVPGSVVKDEWRPLTVAKAAFRSTLKDLTDSVDVFLVLLIRLPVLLLQIGVWLLVAWILYRVARFAYRKAVSAPAAPSTTPKQ